MTSPFTNAAQGLSDLAASLGNVKGELATLTFSGEGAVADQLNENLEKYAEVIAKLEEAANNTAEDAQTQANADEELLNAPSEEEVEELKQKYLEVKRKAANGEATDEELEDAQNEYLDAKRQREDALKKHTEETEFSNLNTDTNGSGDGSTASSSSSDTSTSPRSGSTLGGDDESRPAGSTELSSDGTQTPQQAMMSQPQQAAQPQVSAQPQMGGGAAPQQAQQPQSNKLAPPNMPSYQGPRDTGKKDGKDPLAFLTDRKVNTNVSGAASPFLNDRGISVTGVTSKVDTSGMNSPAVSATGSQPGSGDQRGNQMGGRMMGGMGGMGGMMGGMGGAQGAGKGAKEKPEIFTQDKDLLGKESLDQAIEGGMIGRDTSAPTTQGDGR